MHSSYSLQADMAQSSPISPRESQSQYQTSTVPSAQPEQRQRQQIYNRMPPMPPTQFLIREGELNGYDNSALASPMATQSKGDTVNDLATIAAHERSSSDDHDYQPSTYHLPTLHQPYQLHTQSHKFATGMAQPPMQTLEQRPRQQHYISPVVPVVTPIHPSATHGSQKVLEEGLKMNEHVSSNNIISNSNNQSNKPNLSGIRSTPTPASKPGTTGTTGTAPAKATELFAGAGPLIESSLALANRPLGAEQVFARLAKQNPSNPKESEKRERIMKWMDKITKELAVYSAQEAPGGIIPIVPDDNDLFQRITYELDLEAPVSKPLRKAIDVNCTSGDWAMDIALKYPKSVVYAIDPTLDLHRPLSRPIPQNCRIRQRDVREQGGQFDWVHQRLGAFRVPILEWVSHLAELGRLTRAGGWIQLAESNGMIVNGGGEGAKLNEWVEKAALKAGLNLIQVLDSLIPTMLEAGWINVESYEYRIPLGEWGGVRGAILMKQYMEMVQALQEDIILANQLAPDEIGETIDIMQRAFGQVAGQQQKQQQQPQQQLQPELLMKVVFAQKPPFSDDIWRSAKP
ncbi:hypothetical protein BGZ94_000295 [Podila epigama]|nr:hypothetical protein BGZ94_000295 [Podila epigama]